MNGDSDHAEKQSGANALVRRHAANSSAVENARRYNRELWLRPPRDGLSVCADQTKKPQPFGRGHRSRRIFSLFSPLREMGEANVSATCGRGREWLRRAIH